MSGGRSAALRRCLRRNGLAALFCAGLAVLTYYVTMGFRNGGSSDFLSHMALAVSLSRQGLLRTFTNGREYLWHCCVQLVHWAGVRNIWKSAALVTAAADAAAYFLAFKLLDRILPERAPRWLLATVTAAAFLASSLARPGGPYYVSHSAVNTWHNPTNIMVRPFALAVFYMTADIYGRRLDGQAACPMLETPSGRFSFTGGFFAQFSRPVFTRAQLVLYPLCVVLSAYAKPSFLQFFAPAILVMLLIDVVRTKGMLLPFCLKLALAYLPAVLVVIAQLEYFFDFDLHLSLLSVPAYAAEAAPAARLLPDTIAVYFISPSFDSFGDFIRSLLHQLRLILLPCAFPLAVALAAPRRSLRDPCFRLALICLIVGWVENQLLHETGFRADHGNFSWGYYVASWLMWTVGAGGYTALVGEKSLSGRIVRWGATPLLIWQLGCGIAYVTKVLETGQFFF